MVRTGAWLVLAVVIGWSVWFAFAVYLPEQFCDFDDDPKCLYSGTISPTWERVVRYAAWIGAVVFSLLGAAMAAGIIGASRRRILAAVIAAVALFATVLISLGAVFPGGVSDQVPGIEQDE